MLSVIIATLDSERALVPTLAALVPGATAGLISEVLLVDGGSTDDTATVADVAGCNFMTVEGPLGRTIESGRGNGARAMAFVPAAWHHSRSALGRRGGYFIEQPPPERTRRRVSARRAGAVAALREGCRSSRPPSAPCPRPEQGLIISKQFYAELGGHSELAADPEDRSASPHRPAADCDLVDQRIPAR